mgnify:CR=1 FL=1
MLAKVPEANLLLEALPQVVGCLQGRLEDLRSGRVPLKELLITQKLSRTLEEYRVPSPVALAVRQLQEAGKGEEIRVGQYARFLFTRGKPGVYAWDLPEPPQAGTLDQERYQELFLRAAHTILQSLGVQEQTLRCWLFSKAGYGAPPGKVVSVRVQTAPLFCV